MVRINNTLSERLVDYATTLKYEDIPPEALERTKQLFLDFLGVAAGGRILADSSPAFVKAIHNLQSAATGTSTVIGDPNLYPSQFAAFLNGAFAHSMDFDDTHREAIMHPGSPLLSTLMALAEERVTSGKEFITAVVVGYDVGCKLGRVHSDILHQRKFHPTATTGIFAASVAGGRLIKASQNEIINALALNLSQTSGSQQFVETGGANKPFQVGLVGHNAIYSLAFSKAGVVGSAKPLEGKFGYFATYAVEGYDLTKASADLGQRFEVMHTAVKPYPSCRYSHSVIDGIIDITERECLDAKNIRRIDIDLSEIGYGIIGAIPEVKRRPATFVDGQFSGYFAAAIAAMEKGYRWQSYQRIQDQEIIDMMDRVNIRASKNVQSLGARVCVTTQKGQRLYADVPLAKGEPELPLTWAELESKFRDLWSNVYSTSAESVISGIKSIEDFTDFRDFTQRLQGR